MRRRELLAGIIGAGAWSLTLHAQQAAKVPRIGYLAGGTRDEGLAFAAVFRQALSRLGYIEGQNLAIEYRFAEGDIARLPQLAAELVAYNVELIVAVPTPAVVAARRATSTIPIVMLNVGDPVGLGLVASLSYPVGNVTGLSFTVGLETFVKALEILKEITPQARVIGIVSNPANPAHARVLDLLEVSAEQLNVRLQRVEVRVLEDFDPAFEAMAYNGTDAVLILADVLSLLHKARLATLAAKHKLPTMHQLRAEAEAGGLVSYGPNFLEPWTRAATYVDKLLKGAKPADLPVEQPTRFELVINLKTAQALGLTIPPTLLARADEVIE